MRVFRNDNCAWMVLAFAIAVAGCADDGMPAARGGGAAAISEMAAASGRTAEAGGEVATDSSKPAIRWLDDANALALADVMNGSQLAAADAELSAWHVDTIRAFAAEMAREHAALQHSIDSASDAMKITPVTPALAPLVRARMQAQVDSMYEHAGRAFDRAYLDEAVASHQLMHLYLARLSAAAENAGVQQVLTAAADTVASQIGRATALRTIVAAADSAAADSLAKRAARRAARVRGEANR
jgi:predicted outer membrane protein